MVGYFVPASEVNMLLIPPSLSGVEQVGSRCDISDLYSGDSRFNSRPEHGISGLNVRFEFLSAVVTFLSFGI
jgi:hypothetical protein